MEHTVAGVLEPFKGEMHSYGESAAGRWWEEGGRRSQGRLPGGRGSLKECTWISPGIKKWYRTRLQVKDVSFGFLPLRGEAEAEDTGPCTASYRMWTFSSVLCGLWGSWFPDQGLNPGHGSESLES